MYEFYSKSTSTLAEDDIRGMQHIYGVPPNRKYKPDNKAKDEEDEMPVWGQTPILPDKCNTSYDAIAMIDGEPVAFRKKYMFSPSKAVSEIRSRWKLSPKLTHVDAVFQTSDKKVMFFISQDVHVFDGSRLAKSYRLKDFGIDESVLKIDAILRKSDNNQIYIFFENSYYRFDEHKMSVIGTKSRITKAFRDVFDFDTGFTYKDGKTYFFKNENSYEFDNQNWVLKRMKPVLSANLFMNCNVPTPEIFTDRLGNDMDYINDEEADFLPEAPNCHDNPEIPCNELDSGTAKKSYTITFFVLVGSSFLV